MNQPPGYRNIVKTGARRVIYCFWNKISSRQIVISVGFFLIRTCMNNRVKRVLNQIRTKCWLKTLICNKWISTFIHRLFFLNSILLSLLLGPLLSDANQPGISTCNTHATEYTSILFLVSDLASLDGQTRLLDGHDWTLKLHSIGQLSRLKFQRNPFYI